MRYIPDLYYFHNKEDFPSDKAILITAKTIGNWCSHYKAKDPKEKESFIEDLVSWLIKNDFSSDIFYNPDDTIFRPYPFKSKLGKFLGKFWPLSSATKVYSPNQWKEVNAFYTPS